MTTAAHGATRPDATGPRAPRATRKIWIDGAFVDQSEAKVSVFDHGFLYGDGCFEGIRAYGGRIFKLRSHLQRLFDSAEKIHLKSRYSIDEVERAVRETVAINDLDDAYIRLVLSRGVGTLGLHPFKCPVPGTIVIADSIELYPPELYETGLKVIVADRPRIPIKCLDPAIKSLNYLNNILAKVEAIEAGVLEAIMLNLDGFVAECTGDNLFVVKDGTVITPAAEAGMLHGITRKFVIDTVAPACGHAVKERMMRLEEVLDADEVFLTGTAAEIIGVTHVGDAVIGNGTVGPVTRELTAEFRSRIGRNAPED
ncbi:MAG: branched-chain-amino-acid transaminase [Phycisphaerales bacterium]|nr:branched-chain-amino-acid transaminase [Phycisphaerae bacterium]NNF44775.1 branched-chain-amino-acid transaminase [Phycisphaerales bacterium]NNM24869.1 branched-chain-amino-acid transaminase [Phycisphaerales bacterium]